MKKITVQINGFNIVLPIGLQTTYEDFLHTDASPVLNHLNCFTTLVPKYLPPTATKVLHVGGWVGAGAQIIDALPLKHNVEHVFWERDPVLVEYLRKQYPQSIIYHTEDNYAELIECYPNWLAGFDAIIFDPSVGTIKTALIKECWHKMTAVRTKMIWMADTACDKIHLNAKHYEKDFGVKVEPTAEGYLKAYDKWLSDCTGYVIVDAMRESSSTYFIAMPRDREFPIPIPHV